jgi:hypothetical protein
MTDTTTPNGLITNAGMIAASANATVANVVYGAQNGIGVNLPQIDGATPMVMMPAYVVVTHAPSMFSDLAKTTLKSLVERHAKDISGIDFQIQLQGTGTPIGHDGQELWIPTNAMRTQVTPTFTWQELTGNLVWNFIRYWIEMIKHPDTQASVLSSQNLDSSMSPMLMSSFSMNICVLQFDPTMRPENLIDAYFITNMWPQETGLLGTKRQIGKSDAIDRQIAFYGVVQHNRNTRVAGQAIAATLGLHRVNYDFAVPVNPVVESDIANLGLAQEATDKVASFTPRS